MTASVASPEILLKRILSLKENTAFFLSLDTVNQSHKPLTEELIFNTNSEKSQIPISYISFETPLKLKPSYLSTNSDSFYRFYSMNESEKNQIISKLIKSTSKNLIIIDSFNYFDKSQLMEFLKVMSNPLNILYGVYHIDISPISNDSPSVLNHLTFLSSVIFDIKHQKIDDSKYYSHLDTPKFPEFASSNIFNLDLTYRRKSGRELQYKYTIDTKKHEYKLILAVSDNDQAEDESLLEGLTTFNLSTNDKQRKQREQVDLPFMEAQKSLGAVGSAIVYTFEKDDDYDEEDPYEDPF